MSRLRAPTQGLKNEAMKPNAAEDWRALPTAGLCLNMIRHADKAFRTFFAKLERQAFQECA
jgi:hypothetical protein